MRNNELLIINEIFWCWQIAYLQTIAHLFFGAILFNRKFFIGKE